MALCLSLAGPDAVGRPGYQPALRRQADAAQPLFLRRRPGQHRDQPLTTSITPQIQAPAEPGPRPESSRPARKPTGRRQPPGL